MQTLTLALSCAAFAANGRSTMIGQPSPDLIVADWPEKPEVHLRNLRGRTVILFLYHTAC